MIRLHRHDLPDGLDLRGLRRNRHRDDGSRPRRDRLCLVQLSAGDGTAHLRADPAALPRRARRRLPEPEAAARRPFRAEDLPFRPLRLAALHKALGVTVAPVACTKIASKLVRTYTDRHGLKDLLRDLLGVDISKQQQSSDWGAPELTPDQLAYAASDVLHLHALWAKLKALLEREGRLELAEACYRFLPDACPARPAGLRGPRHLQPLNRRGKPPVSRHSLGSAQRCGTFLVGSQLRVDPRAGPQAHTDGVRLSSRPPRTAAATRRPRRRPRRRQAGCPPPLAARASAPNAGQLARRRVLVGRRQAPAAARCRRAARGRGLWPEIESNAERSRVASAASLQARPDALACRAPRYQGVDEQNRPFTVTASTAAQAGQRGHRAARGAARRHAADRRRLGLRGGRTGPLRPAAQPARPRRPRHRPP